jgi:hypothetical protein
MNATVSLNTGLSATVFGFLRATFTIHVIVNS